MYFANHYQRKVIFVFYGYDHGWLTYPPPPNAAPDIAGLTKGFSTIGFPLTPSSTGGYVRGLRVIHQHPVLPRSAGLCQVPPKLPESKDYDISIYP